MQDMSLQPVSLEEKGLRRQFVQGLLTLSFLLTACAGGSGPRPPDVIAPTYTPMTAPTPEIGLFLNLEKLLSYDEIWRVPLPNYVQNIKLDSEQIKKQNWSEDFVWEAEDANSTPQERADKFLNLLFDKMRGSGFEPFTATMDTFDKHKVDADNPNDNDGGIGIAYESFFETYSSQDLSFQYARATIGAYYVADGGWRVRLKFNTDYFDPSKAQGRLPINQAIYAGLTVHEMAHDYLFRTYIDELRSKYSPFSEDLLNAVVGYIEPQEPYAHAVSIGALIKLAQADENLYWAIGRDEIDGKLAKEYIRLQGTNEDDWWSDPWVVFVRDVAVGQ